MTSPTQKFEELRQAAEDLYASFPDWATFYRQVLGPEGVVRREFKSLESIAAFEQSEAFQEIQGMITDLRKRASEPLKEQEEETKVITVRIPSSMHEALRNEAHDHRTSINKLCISKLLQSIDAKLVPPDVPPKREKQEKKEKRGRRRAAGPKGAAGEGHDHRPRHAGRAPAEEEIEVDL
jgi:predicted HicB family RNase H-like nuclease